MTELSQTIRRTPTPLPMPFRPMADAITGGRRVLLSSDTASRRALRKVGKVAATTDNVIHLAADPTPGHRINEVIAHELTHVANPSPVARFFADGHDSAEERQADRVARVMATSPIAPTASTLQRPGGPALQAGGGSGSTDVIRRSAASDSSGGSSGGVSAAALAASITGRSATSGTVQRLAQSPPAPSAAPSGLSSSPPPVPSRDGRGELSLIGQLQTSPEAREWFAEQLERNFGWLVTALEDRMLVEFERRGGRLWEGL